MHRKQHSEETKEIARAKVAAGDSLSQVARELGVAKSTLSGWLNQTDWDGHQQTREDQKQRFIRQAWDSVFKAITVGDKRLGFVLENADTLDRAVMAVTSSELSNTDKAQVLKVLASLANVPLRDLAIYIGTVYDKIALASGEPTSVNKQTGQVINTNEHKYHIVQEFIGQPEVAERIKENFRSRFRNSSSPE